LRFPKLSLAPMAGYSDAAFREICRRWGAEMTYSEMISSRAVLMRTTKIPKDRCVIQLFGSDPAELAEAAEKVSDRAVWLNLNAGCPVKKVVKRGAGAALLKDLPRLRTIVREIKKRVQKPLSVKTRLGWEKDDSERIVSLLAEEGVDLVEIHARTAIQLYNGKARRDAFERLKNHFDIPIFASGDVFTPEDIDELLNHRGVDGVLVARGAVGSPWIFKAARLRFEGERYYSPTIRDRCKTVLTHLKMLSKDKGERKAIVEFRKFITPYTKGLRGAKEFRRYAMTLKDYSMFYRAIEEFFSTSFQDQLC